MTTSRRGVEWRWIGPLIAHLALLLLLCAAEVNAATAPIFLHAGQLLDVERGTVLHDQLIRIEGQRIAEIAPWRKLPRNAVVIDWSGYTVLPGLIDVHTHLAIWDTSNNVAEELLHSAQETALVGAAHARATLLAGFTSVHDVGCFRALTDVALRNAINRGWVIGPRMNVVGAFITAPGGAGDLNGLAPDVTVPADMRVGVIRNPQEARLAVDYLFVHGVDSIKLLATGGVLTEGTNPGQQELTEEEMRAAVEQARLHGGWVVAHAHGAEGIKAAILAGVRAIEHASLIDEDGIALAKTHGTFLDMDIYNADYIEEVGTREGWPASYLQKNRSTGDLQRNAFKKAVQAGLKMAFATDAGVYPHGLNARQFAFMVRYGMSPLQAIQAATVRGAELLGWQNDVGSIAPGHFADLIAVQGDVLADIKRLEHVSEVMKGGQLVR